MDKAEYFADKFGARYPATFAEGIDFMRHGWPEFVRNIDGLSVLESWGRWSDANIAPLVRFEFSRELPKKFTLVLSAHPYGPNTDQDLIVRIDSQEHRLKIVAGISEMRLPIDRRKLGVGFIRLRFDLRHAYDMSWSLLWRMLIRKNSWICVWATMLTAICDRTTMP